MNLVRSSLPKVSQEFIEAMQAAFPHRAISPKDDMRDIMFEAGQQDVINWILHNVPKTTMHTHINRELV